VVPVAGSCVVVVDLLVTAPEEPCVVVVVVELLGGGSTGGVVVVVVVVLPSEFTVEFVELWAKANGPAAKTTMTATAKTDLFMEISCDGLLLCNALMRLSSQRFRNTGLDQHPLAGAAARDGEAEAHRFRAQSDDQARDARAGACPTGCGSPVTCHTSTRASSLTDFMRR
jgi:hypothetical protein